MAFVLRIDLQQECMDLVPETSSLRPQCFALAGQEIQDSSHVLQTNARQMRSLLEDEGSDGTCIEPVRLARPSSVPTTQRGPSGVDFIHALPGGDKMLGKTAPVTPCAFNAPAARSPEGARPSKHFFPSVC